MVAKLPFVITGEQFADWMAPSEAVDLLTGAYGSRYIAIKTLIARLRGGLVLGVARSTIWPDGSGENLQPVTRDHWDDDAIDAPLWITGDWERRYRDSFEKRIARYFDVRFDPDQVREIIASQRGKKLEPVSTDAPDDAAKGPSVPQKHLEAWYQLYKSVYPDNSEDHAWGSARGMFPNHSVSRARVRSLRGDRDLGRPKVPR